MFIESLKVSYPSEGWSLEETKFDRFNLLVGASGVGKTRILEAIGLLSKLSTKDIDASEVPVDSIVWELVFRINNESNGHSSGSGDEFGGGDGSGTGVGSGFGDGTGIGFDINPIRWTGRVIKRASDKKSNQKQQKELFFEEEEIQLGEVIIAKRINNQIVFWDKPMPRMASDQSLFSLFEENPISSVAMSIQGIDVLGESKFEPISWDESFPDLLGKSLEEIRNSREKYNVKLWWAQRGTRSFGIFKEIFLNFQDIFPSVTKIETGWSSTWIPNDPKSNVSLDIHVFEEGVAGPIPYERLAAGMQKTLEILVQVALCPNNSLILLDEFENSLGPNCLSSITDAILNTRRGLQFIVTSHHPYIINNVDFQYWKIVTRIGGKVSTRPALETGLGRSRQEKFFQLINLEEFLTGVTKIRP